MNTEYPELESKVRDLIKELWPIKGRLLHSQHIWLRLVESGYNILPAGTLAEIFYDLRDNGYIECAQGMGGDGAIGLHGQLSIFWVHPTLLE
jgi:hypothetical protein